MNAEIAEKTILDAGRLIGLCVLLAGCATTGPVAPAAPDAQRQALRSAALVTLQPGMPERHVRETLGAPDNIVVTYKPYDRNSGVRDGFAYVYLLGGTNAVADVIRPPARAVIWFSNDRVITKVETTNRYAATF